VSGRGAHKYRASAGVLPAVVFVSGQAFNDGGGIEECIMASIQSLGIGSGILTTKLVEDLVSAERSSVDLRLDLQTTEFEAEISAFGAITESLESFRVATAALSKTGATDSLAVSSSDASALTATTTSVAEAGSFAITVDKLAQSHSLVTKAYEGITDIIGTGELTFRFGETTYSGDDYAGFSQDTAKSTKTLTIDSTNNTLASMRAAINNADFGVQASIVNDGSGFRLLLATEDPGLSNSMEILVASDDGSGLKSLAFNGTYNGVDAVGAITEGGSTDLSTGIDFSATPATFSLSLGGTAVNVTVNLDATGDLGGGGGTAEDNRVAIQAAVNAALVTAGASEGDIEVSIDPDDNGVVFTSLATGAAQTIEVTADDGVLGLNAGLGERYGSDGSMVQTQAAQSAELTVNGLAITRESNQVTEVISGVTLNLSSADPDKTISLNITSDPSALTTKVQTFIDSFNELKVLSDNLTVFDIDTGDRGLLLGDSTLRSVNSRIRNVMNSLVEGIVDSNFRSLSEVGINTDQNNSFLLQLDSAKFNAAVSENPDAIKSLFSTNRSSTDPLIEVINTGSNTKAGSYAIEITQLATQGNYLADANAALDANVVIDADNDTFVINVNGTQSAAVTLTQGTFATGAALAQELQTRINNDVNISKAGDAVTVSYDSNNHRFSFLSSEYGAASSISFSSQGADLEADLGFGSSVGLVTAGLDVQGSIDGEVASGTGQFLRASEGALTARPGFASGTPAGSLNVPLTVTSGEVTAGDYDFKINVDGAVSGTISLAAGTYNTGEELAAALATAINADSVLLAAGTSVDVDYDIGLNSFGAISSTTGTASQVNFTELSANMASQYGFGLGGGTQGTNATGNASDAAGLRVRVQGGTLGDRGTASYVEGTAFQLSQLFDEILGPGGVLDSKVSSLTSLLDGVADSKILLDERMSRLQDQLSSQFATADLAISGLKTTEDFLTQQLSMLSAFYTNDS
jgi:flagellar capping protein FliD